MDLKRTASLAGDILGPVAGPPLLYRSVQERIKRYILEHDLQAGDPLPPETHLARTLGVSRSSVREAVKALESLGILETRPGKGLFVRPFSLDPILDNLAYSLLFDRDSVTELLEVREHLEVGLLPQAMRTLSPGQLELLRSLVRRMQEKAARGEPFPEEDRFFHRTLSEATGNRLLVKLLDVFWIVFLRLRNRTVRVDPAPQRTWEHHQRILAAIEAGDVAAAQQAMVAHFSDLHRRLALAQPGPRGAAPQTADEASTPGGRQREGEA